MVKKHYINVKTFDEFKKNQKELIDILNHSMTKVKSDISWLKRLSGWQVGLLTVILASLIIKFMVG